jgi:hypothetical protein
MTPTETTPPVHPYDPNPAGFEAAIAAWIEYHEARQAGKVDPERKLANQHIAFYEGSVIDHDTDYLALRSRVDRIPGIDPERLVLDFLAVYDGIVSLTYAVT